MTSRARLVVMAIAVALVSPAVADGQVATNTTIEQSALDGCLRIHHIWKSQLAIESRTRGDSARRADELLRKVFHPYRKFWDPIVGASEAQFLRSLDRHLYELNWEHRQPLPLGRDPGAQIVEASQRVAGFVRRPVPCGEWHVAFGIGAPMQYRDLGMVIDYRVLVDQLGTDPIGNYLSEMITRRIFRESHRADPDSGRTVAALLEEGIVTYAAAAERGRGLSMHAALGYEENVLHWAVKNEHQLWDAAKPRLRDRGLGSLFEFSGSRGLPGVGRLDRIISFRIVEQYVALHGPDSWRDFFVKPSMELLDASGYDARLAADSTVFRITTNEFWLNLHHFLYVLGRAQAGERDATREAVAQAPVEAARVLARLDSADQATWSAAVTAYAEGVSKRDAVFDQQLTFIANTLAGADVTTHLPYGGPQLEVVEALRRAAPIYRDAWWPEHEVANRRWADSMRTLVDEHGAKALAYIRRAYGMPWPVSGYPVRVVAYANWAGAYSTRGQLLVVSSLAPSTQGLYGMEINFHEAMHQWDDSVTTIIGQQANRHRVSAPVNLSHQMIFFTAGEAVRSVVPDHEPYAERFGLWERLGPGVHPVLKELWLPHLQGRGERDAAIGEVVKRLASP